MQEVSLRTTRWSPGKPIVRREVWKGLVWMGMAAIVVEDLPTHLAIFVPTGAPFGYADGEWPTGDGLHPWQGSKTHWSGHGCLMLQAPGDPYAIWHFWSGPERAFAGWYLNLQDPFWRSGRALDTLDHEVDVVVNVDGSAELKDVNRVVDCVRMGRFDEAFGEVVIRSGQGSGGPAERSGRSLVGPRLGRLATTGGVERAAAASRGLGRVSAPTDSGAATDLK